MIFLIKDSNLKKEKQWGGVEMGWGARLSFVFFTKNPNWGGGGYSK